MSRGDFSVQKLGDRILVADYLKVVSGRFFVAFLVSRILERLLPLNPDVEALCSGNRISYQHMNIPLNCLPRIVNVLIGLHIEKALFKRHFQGEMLSRRSLLAHLF